MALYLAIRQGTWQPNDIDVYVGEVAYGAFCEEFALTMNAEEAPVDGQPSSPLAESSYSPGIKHVRKFSTVRATYDIIQHRRRVAAPYVLSLDIPRQRAHPQLPRRRMPAVYVEHVRNAPVWTYSVYTDTEGILQVHRPRFLVCRGPFGVVENQSGRANVHSS